MRLPFTILEDEFVRLEAIGEQHRAALREACEADRRIWTELYPYSMLDEHFDTAWARLSKGAADGTWQPYIVMVEGRCAGISCYLAISPENQTLEMGGTYYRPEFRGGFVNPAAKRLLLANAFDGGARRVQFRVDEINLRSRAAVLKLGAVQEGIMRQDWLTWTGRVRSTVVFSILSDEWPVVRQRLDQRLAAFERVAVGG